MKLILALIMFTQFIQYEQMFLDRYVKSVEYYEIRESIGFKDYIKK